MSRPDRATVIALIRALQRLAASTNFKAEALAAAKKAAELARQYGITAADLQERAAAAPAPKATKATKAPPPSPRGTIQAPPPSPPVTIQVKIGTFRIRWRP